MAGCVLWIVTLCVFVDIFVLTHAQLGHMINIAFNKACNLSSRYTEGNRFYGITFSGDCSAAINGNTDTNFDIKARPPNCIHTATNDTNPLWQVDLGRNFSLHSIIIYGRINNIGRMDCVEVSLDGEHVYTFPCPGTVNVTTVIDLSPPRHGRVVTITRNYTTPGDYSPFLSICEVQIWVCQVGWWGSDCQTQCSQMCQGAGDDTGEDNYCDSDNGACVKGCSDGYYNVSNDCQNTCGEGCHDTCSRTNGTCQCQPGWQPPLCQWCADGWFGSECTECGHCANNSVCDKKTGVCPFCDGDFVAPLCLEVLEKMPLCGDKETAGLAGPVAGAAVGCSIVFLITGILIGLFLRRSRSKQNTEHLSSPNEISSTAERSGSTSLKDTSDYSNNVYDALDPRDESIAPYTSLHIQTSSKGT
ncbi:uncharacterized protein LOC112572689 isoform X2 [Pomacea canaliculata]|uniref:uncharacterized protein LOC112572689 isoform X2 n=1 Tax=Pomacea canaliculata TaxID=400727 RepID=UPI000D7289D1|nr:uncharacterized protein LOC112572689 isoform X2 [Pomacea canaliculata]